MKKRKINAKQVVRDIQLGLSDVEMMEKYELSSRGLQSLFEKVIAEGLVDPIDIEDRTPLHSRTVTVNLYRCPACSMPQFDPFEVCPQCGVIVTKFKGFDAGPKTDRKTPSVSAPQAQSAGEAPESAKALEEAELEAVLKPLVFDQWQLPSPTVDSPPVPTVKERLPEPGSGIKKAGPAVLNAGVQPRAPFKEVRVQRSKGGSVAPVTQISGLKWKFKTEGQIFASPAISDGVVVIGSWDGNLYAVEMASGNEMWRFQTEGAIHASAVIAYGTVFFGSLERVLLCDRPPDRPERVVLRVGCPHILNTGRGGRNGLFHQLQRHALRLGCSLGRAALAV